MTQPSLSANPRRIERLPAGGLPGFCCEARNCPECVTAYRRGIALLDETFGKSAPVAARKPRRPSLKRQITAAEKATGKPVTSITLADGTTINLSQEPSGGKAPRDASVVAPARIIALRKRGA